MRSHLRADADALRGRHASFEFPSTARAGRHAARTWFETAPDMPPAEYRDRQFHDHCKGKPDTAIERRVRRAAFKQAFAEALGHIIVEEARFHAHAA